MKTENLPKWAQQDISRLKRRVVELESIIEQFHTTGEADTFMWESTNLVPLGKHVSISFKLPQGTVNIRSKGDSLDVNAESQVALFPRASNAFDIKFIR